MQTAYVSDPHPVDRSSAHTGESTMQSGHALHAPGTSRAISHLLSLNDAPVAAQPAAQMAPHDFQNLALLQLDETTYLSTNYWTPLKAAVLTYSQLAVNPQTIPRRKELLREMGIMALRWRKAHGLPQKPLNELSQNQQNKANAVNALEQQMILESTELHGNANDARGRLNVPQPGEDEVFFAPLLTDVRKEKDGRFRGFFIGDTDIVDAQNNVVGHVDAGVVCRAIPNHGAPLNRDQSGYFWVTPAPERDHTELRATVREFTPGYVLRDAVNYMNLEAPIKSDWEERFSPDLHPLFVGPPTVDDVRQAFLGNCYLLASVLSIVRQDPDHFPEHMIDHGNGVVTVRLYQKNGNAYQAIDVHVRKSEAIDKSATTTIGETYNKSALWVQILEKAYGAAGFTGTKIDKLPQGVKNTYSQIATGNAPTALGHLLGRDTHTHNIKSFDQEDTDPLRNWIDRGGNNDLLQWLATHNMAAQRAEMMQLTHFALGDVLGNRLAALARDHDALRMHEVVNFVREQDFSLALKNGIIGFLRDTRRYPGKRGTGQYSARQVDAFLNLKNVIDNGRYPVLGTGHYMKRGGTDHSGQSGGENKHAGLAAPHGYELVDYTPHNFDPQNVNEDRICWVKIRNPWGHTGRGYREKGNPGNVYNQNNTQPVVHEQAQGLLIIDNVQTTFDRQMEAYQIDDAECWIPLEELTKRFNSITYV